MSDARYEAVLDSSSFEKSGRIMARTFEDIQRKATSAAERMDAVGASASNIGETVKRLAGLVGIGFGVNQLIRYADQAKNIEGRLRLVTRSTEELVSVQRQLFDVANRTGQSFQQTAETYSRLARNAKEAGYSSADFLRVTEAVNQAVTISGAAAGSAQAALVQLGQGLASGTLRGEELNSVLEQTPRLAEAIAAGLGIQTGQLRTVAMQGKLTATEVMKAIIDQSGVLSAEFQKMPLTVERGMTIANNYMLEFVGRIDKATGASDKLARAIILLAKNLDLIAIVGGALMFLYGFPAIITAVGTAMTFAGGAALYLAAGQWRVVAANLAASSAFAGLTAAISANPYVAAGVAIVALGAALYGLYRYIKGAGDESARMAEEQKKVASEIKSAKESVTTYLNEALVPLEMKLTALNRGGMDGFKKVEEVLKRTQLTTEFASGALEDYYKRNNVVQDKQVPLREALLSSDAVIRQTANNALLAGAKFADMSIEVEKNKASVEKATETQKKFRDELKEVIKAMSDNYSKAMIDNSIFVNQKIDETKLEISELGRLTEAYKKGEAAVRDTTDAIAAERYERELVNRLLGPEQIQKLMADFRARQQATRQLEDAQKAAQQAARETRKENQETTRDLEREGQRQERAMREPFLNAIRGIQTSLTSFFEQLLSGGVRTFEQFADAFRRTILRMIAEVGSAQVMKQVFQGTSLGALLGLPGGVVRGQGAAGGFQSAVPLPSGPQTFVQGGPMSAAGSGFGAAQGIGLGIGSAALGYGLGRSSGALGTGLGALSGAAAGFAMGGPVGAVVGGVAGLVGGLLGQAARAREAAKQMREAGERWNKALESFREAATPALGLTREIERLQDSLKSSLNDLAASIGSRRSGGTRIGAPQLSESDRERYSRMTRDQFNEERRQAAEMAGSSNTTVRLIGEQMLALFDRLKEGLEAVWAASERLQRQFRDDLTLRGLLAQGKEREAELMRQEIAQRDELAAAMESMKRGTITADDVRRLEEVQRLEREALRRRQNALVSFGLPSGFDLYSSIYTGLRYSGPAVAGPPPTSGGTTSGGGRPVIVNFSDGAIIVDGAKAPKEVAKEVLAEFKTLALQQLGTEARWSEVM